MTSLCVCVTTSFLTLLSVSRFHLLILEVGNTSQSLAELGLHILQPSLEIPGGALPTPRCTPAIGDCALLTGEPGPTELFSRFNLFSLSVLEFNALAVVARQSIPGRTLETVGRYNGIFLFIIYIYIDFPIIS